MQTPPHRSRPRPARRRAVTTTAVAAAGLLLSSCASPTGFGGSGHTPAGSTPGSTSSAGSNEREVTSLSPRVVLSHAGGITTLDASTGQVVDETAHPGFLRLANAGDGRHVMVSDSDTFRVYDTGVKAQPHGDHDHHFEYTPGLTGVTFPAPHAGHVVVHDGKTTLFGDGDGSITTFESETLKGGAPEATERKTEHPHHGVALELADGTLIPVGFVTDQSGLPERLVVDPPEGLLVVDPADDDSVQSPE